MGGGVGGVYISINGGGAGGGLISLFPVPHQYVPSVPSVRAVRAVRQCHPSVPSVRAVHPCRPVRPSVRVRRLFVPSVRAVRPHPPSSSSAAPRLPGRRRRAECRAAPLRSGGGGRPRPAPPASKIAERREVPRSELDGTDGADGRKGRKRQTAENSGLFEMHPGYIWGRGGAGEGGDILGVCRGSIGVRARASTRALYNNNY